MPAFDSTKADTLLLAGDVLPCSSLSQLVMTVAAVFAFNHSPTDEQVVIESRTDYLKLQPLGALPSCLLSMGLPCPLA